MEPHNSPLHALLSVAAIQHELDRRRVQRKQLLQPKQEQPKQEAKPPETE